MHPEFDRDPMAKAEWARQLRLTVAGRAAREAVRGKARRLRTFCNSAPVPMLPFSREGRRLECLKHSLTVYRLAFGQPRQEDLLEYLQSLLGTDAAIADLAELQIRLNLGIRIR